jgi:UDPglucose 6-dehydrogenase/GDP-mannose 6-dehydrogenase
MQISVIGAGYVGLVSGVCLAELGHDIVCVDVDEEKVATMNRGQPPFHEEGLDALLGKHIGGRLTATTDISRAVEETDLTLICVGTPSREDGIDLTYIQKSSAQIGTVLRRKSDYHTVVVKSTVVPGTTDTVVRPVLEETSGKQAGVDFGIGMNPEFLTEGQAVRDFMAPDRIVIGGIDDRTRDELARVYEVFPDAAVVRVNNKTAEMIKYASNAVLATQISFANEIANLCSSLGDIDVVQVMDGVHLSYYLQPFVSGSPKRVKAPIASFLEAGCGYGGSCLPKDLKAIIAQGKGAGASMRVLEAVEETNAHQPERMIQLLGKHFPDLAGVRVAVLGLAFKPGTDDMRESPAIPIVRGLLARGAVVRAYDPVATESAQRALEGTPLDYCRTLEDALDGADAVMLVTRWEEFQRVPDLLASRAPQPVVVDGRRVLDRTRLARYEGIGLGDRVPLHT